MSTARPGRHWREAGARPKPRFSEASQRELSATHDPHALAHCTRPRLPTRCDSSLSSTVSSARRAFELCALPALAYKYEAQWRGPAPDHDASRIHIDINWRCSRCPPNWFYCLSISYSQLAKARFPNPVTTSVNSPWILQLYNVE